MLKRLQDLVDASIGEGQKALSQRQKQGPD